MEELMKCLAKVLSVDIPSIVFYAEMFIIVFSCIVYTLVDFKLGKRNLFGKKNKLSDRVFGWSVVIILVLIHIFMLTLMVNHEMLALLNQML